MKEGLLKGVPDLCAVDQAAGLSCPTTRAIFNSSIVWQVLSNALSILFLAYIRLTGASLVLKESLAMAHPIPLCYGLFSLGRLFLAYSGSPANTTRRAGYV